jgi:hypothetical protein
MKIFRRALPEIKSPRGEKDVTVGTTVHGHLVTHPAAPRKPSGPLKPTVILPVPVASMAATLRLTSAGAPRKASGLMSGTSAGTTTPSAQVDKTVPPGVRPSKTPVYSLHFRRKSLRGVSDLVRFGRKVYWWVD